MVAMHKEKKFQCSLCPEAFAARYKLTDHETRIHIKPFKCNLCQKGNHLTYVTKTFHALCFEYFYFYFIEAQ